MYPASLVPISTKRSIVEVGPGRGDFLFHLAETNKDATVIGIEIKPKRFDKLVRRIEHRGLKNICLIQDDARDAIKLFAKNLVDEIYIQFPDPWPKRKHGHNRAICYDFLTVCSEALKQNGTISIITDYEDYALAISKDIRRINSLASAFDPPIESDLPDTFPTFFAQKWRKEGRSFYHQRYIKSA